MALSGKKAQLKQQMTAQRRRSLDSGKLLAHRRVAVPQARSLAEAGHPTAIPQSLSKDMSAAAPDKPSISDRGVRSENV